MSWDYVLKFVIIGDASVGKSSILFRLTDQKFLNNPDPTLGADFGAKLISTDGKTCKLQCWDTAGTESFRSITRSYYRGAAGALIVYDVTRRTSFDNCRSWLKDVRQHADPHLTAILVANKVDLCESDAAGGESRSRHRREVTTEEGERFAQEEGLLFIEASAKSGHNVEAAFDEAARDILRKIQSGVFNDSKSPGVHSAGKRAAQVADPNTSLTLETQEPKAACCRT